MAKQLKPVEDPRIQQMRDRVTAVFYANSELDKSRLRLLEFGVNVQVYSTGYTVTAYQMYDYLPLTFRNLQELAVIFGTENFQVGKKQPDGYETCDYGSNYSHEFTVSGELPALDGDPGTK